MTPFVVAYQDIFFFGRLPSISDTVLILTYSTASLLTGFFVFDRLRDTFAEEV
jgi:ABC-type polysaccharide/polyol phosphate export permease